MNDPVTIKEIARRLNVSVSTVSRALHNHPRISEQTKKAVLRLADELDYQPNSLALNLLNRRSKKIGVIVPRISYHFYSLAISGIEDVAIRAGYNIIICQSNESYEREVANVNDLMMSRVDGIIASLAGETTTHEHFRKITAKRIPLVLFNRVSDEIEACKIVVDNHQATFSAVEHLLLSGCRRIAFLAGPRLLHISNQRFDGYRAAHAKYGLPIDEHLIVHNDFSQEGAITLTRDLLQLSPPPDALFAVSDRLAVGAMLAIKGSGKRIPQDIAVVGFNNDPVCEWLEPSLSSVDQDAFEMGKIAGQRIFEQITHEHSPPAPATTVLKTRLIIRNSSVRQRFPR